MQDDYENIVRGYDERRLPALVDRDAIDDPRLSANGIALLAYLDVHTAPDKADVLRRFNWSDVECDAALTELAPYGVKSR